MAGSITISTRNAQILAKLKALQDGAADMRPMFEAIGSTVANRIRLGFKVGADPWGNPWAPLKIRAGQPLRDTRRLMGSITPHADSSGVTIGTNLLYARVHQFGATIKPVKAKRLAFPGPVGKTIFAKSVTIPARPYLPISPATRATSLPPGWSKDVLSTIKSHLIKTTKDA